MGASEVVTTIPYIDLAAEYRAIQPELDQAVLAALASGRYILGPNVEQLEAELAKFCGTRQVVTVGSGTDALEFALRAIGVRPGDEVVTVPMTFVATAEAIVHVGARPVFVDIDPCSYTMDVAQVEARLTPKTRAILPVHLYGHPCRMRELVALAQSRGVAIVEDCAQAIGASLDGRLVGTFGRAGAFSFFPTKNLGACGDGGMVISDDADVAQVVRWVRAHGSPRRDDHQMIGRTGRLDELQAAVLRVKLRYLPQWTEARRRLARHYTQLIHARVAPKVPGLQVPSEAPGVRHVYHLYALRAPRRDALLAFLQHREIGALVHYSRPVHRQPAFAFLGHRDGEFPVAEALARETISLPLYPFMTEAMVERVVGALEAFYTA